MHEEELWRSEVERGQEKKKSDEQQEREYEYNTA